MKMTNSQTREFLSDLSIALKHKHNLSANVWPINRSETTGNGSTASYFDDTKYSVIGIKELAENPDAQTDTYTFMKAFMSVIHESTHIYQRDVLLHEKSDTANYLAVGYMAEMASKKYYEDNYNFMPHEIAAQYSAVKNGYSILAGLEGESRANSLVCMYVNKHINDELMPKPAHPYSKIEDILSDYEKAFADSKTIQRKFEPEEYVDETVKFREEHPDINKNDVIRVIGDVPMRCLIEHDSKTLDKIRYEAGIKQDFALAGAYMIRQRDDCKYWDNKEHVDIYTNEFNEKCSLEAIKSVNVENKFAPFKKKAARLTDLDLQSVTPDMRLTIDDLPTIDSSDLALSFSDKVEDIDIGWS